MAIAYSSLTLGEVLTEVVARIKSTRTNINIDWGELVNIATQARRELSSRILPFMEWSFIKTVPVAHMTILPNDYIRPVRVILSVYGEKTEARMVDPLEWADITNPVQYQSYAQALNMQPAYMIWANSITTTPAWASFQMSIWCHPSTATGWIDYIALHGDADLSGENSPINIPPESENLFINMILERWLFRHGEKQQKNKISQEVQRQFIAIRQQEAARKATEAAEIESLVPETEQIPSTVRR